MSYEKLREAAIAATNYSYSPYSQAKVGSAILTNTGEMFTGCNIENSSFGGTVCAERVAIWKAVSTQKCTIDTVYVYTQDGWPPCGMCLQVLSEFSTPSTTVIIGDASGKEETIPLRELLPKAFTPEHLIKS